MNEKLRMQYFVWAGIALVALLGIGLMAFLAGRLSLRPTPASPTATPIATPTPLPPPVITIQSIKAKAELATVEYNSVAEIYNENMPAGWLDKTLGTKERLLMLVYGNVKAGFDLNTMNDKNLWTDGKRVRLVLPPPKILSSSLDFDRTHIVYYENNMLLEKNDPNLEGEALARATAAIEQAAKESEILNKANEYGRIYFENMLYSLGFTDVEVVVDAQMFKE